MTLNTVSIFHVIPMFGYGHFQAYNLFQLTKYGTSSVPKKVFSCAELYSKVSRATGCQKVEEIEKVQKNDLSSHFHNVQGHFKVLKFDP